MLMAIEGKSEKAAAVEFLAGMIGVEKSEIVGDMPFSAVAVLRRGAGAGVVLFTNYRRNSVEVIAAGFPGWMMPRDLGAIADYAFYTLGASTVRAMIALGNKPAENGARKLGFRRICALRDEFGPGRDAGLYELHREECKWLLSQR